MQTPTLDAKTAAYLDGILAPIDKVPMAMYVSGTTYLICNSTHCATYRMTFSGEYVGSDRTAIDPPPNGREPNLGGGDGSSGGGQICEIVTKSGQACSSVDGGGKSCENYVYQIIECW